MLRYFVLFEPTDSKAVNDSSYGIVFLCVFPGGNDGTSYVQVNEDIIIAAATLYECDYSVNKFANYLRFYAKYLNDVSGIDSRDWDLQKVATALTLICCPDEKIETGNSKEVNSKCYIFNLSF